MRIIDYFKKRKSKCFVGEVAYEKAESMVIQQSSVEEILEFAKEMKGVNISKLEDASITAVVNRLEVLGEKFGVNFILSVSCDESELDESLKSKVIVSL